MTLFGNEFLLNELLPTLNKGLWISLMLIVPSAVLGFLAGVFLGVIRVFGTRRTRWAGDAYTAIFRGVPLAIQLMLIYFGLPNLGISLDPYPAAVCSFTLCSAAYHSEYIRGSLLAIRQGQMKAALALGFNTPQAALWIIVPQAARLALPGCGNEIIYLIKYSSLAYLVTCMELTGQGKLLAALYFRFTEVFLGVGLYYLTLVTLTGWLLRRLEQKLRIPGFGLEV
ncbi:MAG: amino acid ABC transporter permease [Betaproteobacteria bacterium]|nr:amino acid ABC transporter permease [Betaproteobacteria bacterium]